MQSIVVDSGPLIALFDRDDRHHRRAVAFIEANTANLVTNLPVIGEVAYMLHRMPLARRDFLNWISVAAKIDFATMDDLPRIRRDPPRAGRAAARRTGTGCSH